MTREKQLEGKMALVTGAASGIGKACVDRFLREGAMVVAADLNISENVFNQNPNLSVITGDVTDASSVKNMVEHSKQKFGGLNILVNSAGVSSRGALGSQADPEDIWDRVIEVNLKGSYLTSWHAVPTIEASGGGSIVNLASIMGIVSYPKGLGGGFNAYPPSKGGIVQLTKGLAIDLAAKNIRVNCLCPGYVETNLTESLLEDDEISSQLISLHPIGRLGKPEEIASAALFLVSDEASFITGSSLVIDGGYTAQ